MKPSFLFILILGIFWSCKNSKNAASTIYPEHILIEIEKRYEFMNTHVFRSDSSIILKEHQKTKLLPILAAKISKLDSLKMMNLEDEERRKRRKAIRKQWHPKIDAVLDSNQVKMRHYYLKL